MKRWIVLIIGGVLLAGILGLLYYNGEFRTFTWETIAMIGAALAAPVKWLFDWIKGDQSNDEKLLESEAKYNASRKAEEERRAIIKQEIQEKEVQVSNLEKDLELMEANLQILEEKKKKMNSDVKSMTTKEADKKLDEILSE